MAAALSRVLGDPALAARLGRQGAARARERYRLDRTVDRYATLYRQLSSRYPEVR
ncbi:hypothetical protein D3C83_299400 [compost metagenome]